MKADKKKKTDKMPLTEAIRMNLRGVRLIRKNCPGLLASTSIFYCLEALIPYVVIYFSARIIDELAGERDPQRLRTLVLLSLTITLAATLLKALTYRWHQRKMAVYHHQEYKIYTDKLLDMDFCSVDDQYTHDLLAQIYQNRNWSWYGLRMIQRLLYFIIEGTAGILGSIALTASFFTQKVPESAGSLTLLNHPLINVGLYLCLAASVLLMSLLSTKGDNYHGKFASEARMRNRIFSFYGFDMREPWRAADMRIYEQQKICAHHMMDEGGLSYSEIMYKYTSPLFTASDAIGGLFMGIVYLFVCSKAWAGAFSVGAVTQYVGAITALSRYFAMLINSFGILWVNAGFLKTTYEFLDIPNDMYQGSLTTEKRADRNYEVEFRDVSFKYPNSETYALRHVSMKFRIGKRLAVVGQNGSGKTTFIKLLCRLYDPTEGEILLNGIDIRKYQYDDYMNIFSVVFQDFQLLAFPLGENVASGKDYDRERVKDCLEKAGFADRLAAMPKGLDTCLYKNFDKDGVEVSGGEAQKIAIARALYKDSPFIILDEPTAALDPIAEAEVYSKFDEIAGDKTAIYISHRLSSCRFCDEIAVFDQGAVIQQGSHEALAADQGGKYYELWHAQAQYYTNSSQAAN